MGKIRVQDLAKTMGISNQDLVFKLKSLGVRVEGDDAALDTDIIQAVLQGKKLPHPREVILRDEPAPGAPVAGRRPTAPAAPARRPAANPLRPQRPRTLIQKVEPNIRTLPASERPVPSGREETLTPADFEMAEGGHEMEIEHEIAASAPGEESMAPPVRMPTPPPPRITVPPPTSASVPPPTLVQPPAANEPQRRGAIIISRPTNPPPPRTATGARPGERPSGPGGRPSGPPRPGGGPGSGPRPGGPSSPGGYGGAGQRPSGPGASSGYGGAGQRPGGPRPGGDAGGPRRDPSGRPPMRRDGGPMPAPPPPMGMDDRKRGIDRLQEQIEREKKKKKAGTKKPGSRADEEAEVLTAFKGTLDDLDSVEDAAIMSGRRKRRVLRKDEETETGKVLTFKSAPPQGPVMLSEGMTLREFAEKLGVRTKDLMKNLFERGINANINQVLEPEMAQDLAKTLGIDAMVVSFEEEVQLRQELLGGAGVQIETKARVPRAPVVTIMGHVDHGKTSLLDAVRSSKLTEAEFGGITQHIGAYQVETHGRKVVFVDTPGHEAFTMMRARGAKITDIVVLVVAADDGVMPQTIEAIDHARAAKVPIVVAINKIDKPNANLDRVKKELSDRGLLAEDWGGDTVMVPLSALKREGIDTLLDMILLTADLLDLKASPDISAQGAIVEARKEVGRGTVATVLVQNGTLRIGDVFVSGSAWGRVRSMSDDLGERVQEAGPSTPVEVTGFNDLPDAGDLMQVVEDESKARSIAEFRAQETRRKGLNANPSRVSLEQFFSKIQEGEVKELPVVLKADVQGSLEVLRDALGKTSTEKVKVLVLHSGVGAISTNDVLLASASKAIIIGFNVRPERSAVELAEKEQVEIRLHTVIYELIDELRKAMTGLLEPTFKEVQSGRAEVREIFRVPKFGVIAGCHVVDGVIPRSAPVRLLRDNRVIYEGKISSLRRFKDDASDVRAGFDCGIGLERFQDFKPGDLIEAFTKEEVAPVL